MKNRILLILFVLLLADVAQAEIDIKEINTDYGIKVWLIEDHTNPVVSMIMTFKNSGYAYDQKKGVSNLVAGLLTEGAGEYSATQIANILESNGIIINCDVTLENFVVRVKALSQHFEKSLMLLQSMLIDPHFDQQALERIRNQELMAIKKLEENPHHVARTKLFCAIFNDHPYMNPAYGTAQDLKKATREDLFQYTTSSLNRVNLNMAVSGDINSESLSSILDKYLINLPLTSKEVKKVPTLTQFKPPAVKQVNVNMNIPQAIVYFGKYGIDLHDPNFYAAYVLNHIVGGHSLDSILMDEIRRKRGLTYGIYTWLENHLHANLFLGTAATDGSSEQEMVLAINEILQNVKRDGVSIEQLQNSKDYIISSFVTKLDTNEKIAETLSYAQNNKLGMKYFNDFSKKISGVTAQDVSKVANNLLDVKKMFLVVVKKLDP